MFLKAIATKNAIEPMEAWDPETGTFTPNYFHGRISIADRFLSNFNKPLRRRMLFTDEKAVMPPSGVIRHPGTKDVYLVGQGRSDANATGGTPYLTLRVCHLVTDSEAGSSGLATLRRKVTLGPPDDPGWLVDTEVGKVYLDMEFRTSSTEENLKDVKTENFTLTAPANIEFEQWDYVDLHGVSVRVVDSFPDSGFSCARADLEEDKRIDVVFTRESGRVYNRVTHTYESGSQEYKVTARIDTLNTFSYWASESEEYFDLIIEHDHIGFRPDPAKDTVTFEGRTRTVAFVSTQTGEKQYQVRCR